MLNRKKARELAEAAYTLTVTFSIGKWAVYAAYLERGYFAVGSEYCLIFVTYWTAWKAIHYLFDVLEEVEYEKSCKKSGSGRSAEK